jgi:hypothetical protein
MIVETEVQGHKWATMGAFEDARANVDTQLGLPNAAADTSMKAMISLQEDGEKIDFYWCGCHPRVDAILGDPVTLQIRTNDGQ